VAAQGTVSKRKLCSTFELLFLTNFLARNNTKMLPSFIITSKEVEKHLSVATSIELLHKAFHALATNKAQLPLRNLMWYVLAWLSGSKV